MPTEVDLPKTSSKDAFVEGDTIKEKIIVEDGNGNAVDITGETFTFTIKDDIDDDDFVAQTVNSSGDHLDPANGETVLTMAAGETAGLGRKQPYDYDIQREKTNGEDKTPLIGEIKIRKGVTDN